MALRKESFDEYHERARTMKNNQQTTQQDNVPIEISRKLYHRAEFAAQKKQITTRQYLEQLLDEIVPEINEAVQPGHPPTLESIEQLRKFREQVFRENDYQFMGNSVEELREIREERLRQLAGDDNTDE